MSEYKTEKFTPEIIGGLKDDLLRVPLVISECSGIRIDGRRIKSIVFTTDLSIILNNNADAILAVYPFTPHPAIFRAITGVASVPVLAGVGGGTTTGIRAAQMATFAEAHGCVGVVVNAPTTLDTIRMLDKVVICPIIGTVVSEYMDIEARLEAGINIINVSGGAGTASLVRSLRDKYPELPIIATGGPTDESIRETIEAGANAITWTPPTAAELFKKKMIKYRESSRAQYEDDHILR